MAPDQPEYVPLHVESRRRARRDMAIAGALLAVFAVAITWYIASATAELDELAPRIEKQLDATYVEDINVIADYGYRSPRLLFTADGTQIYCQVLNLGEMSDDPDLAPDFRCTEPWPELTPEPAG